MVESDIWDNILNETQTEVINSVKVKSANSSNKVKTNKDADSSQLIKIRITRTGTYIKNTTDLPHELIKKIKKYYTISDKTIMGYMNHVSNWYYRNSKLYLPRFGAHLLTNKFSNIEYKSTILQNNPIPHINFTGTFNGNQELIFNEIMNNHFDETSVKAGKAGLILNLQAGMGKTFLAMALIGKLKCRTLVVTHMTSVLDQWVKLLNQYFPGVEIGQYYGKKKKYGEIVVGVINSLLVDPIKLNMKSIEVSKATDTVTRREFYDSFDFVIFDEAHLYCSPTSRKIYEYCQAPYMIGLSATPSDRTADKLYKINHWGIGSVLVADQLKDYTTKDIPFKGRVTQVKYSGHHEYTEHIINERLGVVSVPLMIGQLCSDPYRIKMIVVQILEQQKKGLNVLVFADRRTYLEEIRLELECYAEKANMLTTDAELTTIEAILTSEKPPAAAKIDTIRLVGGSKTNDFEIAKEKKNIILSTYQFFGTGVSIPKLNCVILTTPRKSNSRQFINRIFRLGSNYDIERQIIDIVDVKTSLKNQWYKRLEYYKEQEFEIDIKKIDWSEFDE